MEHSRRGSLRLAQSVCGYSSSRVALCERKYVYIDGGGRGLFYEEMSCGSAVSLLFFVGS